MKENILDVLMYLFENYMDEEILVNYDQELLKIELMEAGFPSIEVSKAFTWLEGLAEQQNLLDTHRQGTTTSIRVYRPEECEKLDLECRAFLLFLEQVGALDMINRELVIDRVMALDSEEVSLEQLKWIVLMVLFNQPGHEASFAWMENLVYEEMIGSLH